MGDGLLLEFPAESPNMGLGQQDDPNAFRVPSRAKPLHLYSNIRHSACFDPTIALRASICEFKFGHRAFVPTQSKAGKPMTAARRGQVTELTRDDALRVLALVHTNGPRHFELATAPDQRTAVRRAAASRRHIGWLRMAAGGPFAALVRLARFGQRGLIVAGAALPAISATRIAYLCCCAPASAGRSQRMQGQRRFLTLGGHRRRF